MTKNFQVDARVVLALGRDSIKDHTTALIELVKNCYDADATKVEIEIVVNINEPYIRIADNGTGMTEEDIDTKWLRIGFSEKIIEKFTDGGRRKTGEKGIGRISADRLGSILDLRTKAGEQKSISIIVDWDQFDQSLRDISSIPIEFLEDVDITLPYNFDSRNMSGTELIIKNLRQDWSRSDMRSLYKELSTLIPPFRGVVDFEIKLVSDVGDGVEEYVKSELNENFEIRLDISYDGKSEFVDYTLTARNPNLDNNRQVIKQSISRWGNLVTRLSNYDYEPDFGPVSLTLLYYPQIPEIIEGTGFRLRDIREFLRSNAGVKIYRDNIRVKPYGNLDAPEGDWLGLGEIVARNPAGAGRSSFVIRPTQLVGAVFISRDDNRKLIDSSAREGLIQGEAFSALRDFLIGCVRLISSHYHESFVEKQILPISVSPSQDVRHLSQRLYELRQDLSSIRPLIPFEADRRVGDTLNQVEVVVDQIKDTQRSIEELQSQATIYRGLSTIGIASTVFGHETQTSIDGFLISLDNATESLRNIPPLIKEALVSLDRAKMFAERVQGWGIFTLERVKRDKRRKTALDIDEVVRGVVNSLATVMTAVGIEVRLNLEPVRMRTFAMDIEAIVLNLLTNAYAACNQKRKNKIIQVEVKRKYENLRDGCEIVVSDSGPGVDPKFREIIWSPLFSTKAVEVDGKRKQIGTGLGLSIVQSILDDLRGSRRVDSHPELKGARFSIWFPIKEG